MNKQTSLPWSIQEECDAIDRAAKKSLEMRRASGEILTYELDGWIVQEHPGQIVERLGPVGEFRAEDFPYPGFTPPAR